MGEREWKALMHQGGTALVTVGLLLIFGTGGAGDCGMIDILGMAQQIIIGAVMVVAGWLILRRR